MPRLQYLNRIGNVYLNSKNTFNLLNSILKFSCEQLLLLQRPPGYNATALFRAKLSYSFVVKIFSILLREKGYRI